jgi:hypothetical protein
VRKGRMHYSCEFIVNHQLYQYRHKQFKYYFSRLHSIFMHRMYLFSSFCACHVDARLRSVASESARESASHPPPLSRPPSRHVRSRYSSLPCRRRRVHAHLGRASGTRAVRRRATMLRRRRSVALQPHAGRRGGEDDIEARCAPSRMHMRRMRASSVPDERRTLAR